MVTLFRLQVANCRANRVYHYALVTSTGEKLFLRTGTGLCALETRLSTNAVALEACTKRGAQVCVLASVSVQEVEISAAAITSLTADLYTASLSLPSDVALEELSTQMRSVINSLDALSEKESSEVVQQVLDYLEASLERLSEGQASGYVVNPQTVPDLAAAAATCPELQTLQALSGSQTIETFGFQTTDFTADSAALLQAQIADSLRISTQEIVQCVEDPSGVARRTRTLLQAVATTSVAVYHVQGEIDGLAPPPPYP